MKYLGEIIVTIMSLLIFQQMPAFWGAWKLNLQDMVHLISITDVQQL